MALTRRERRIRRHVILGATLERALEHDLQKIIARIGRAAAEMAGNGQAHLAANVVAQYEQALHNAIKNRLTVAALASAKLVITELASEGKSDFQLETKFLSLFEIAQSAVTHWIVNYSAQKVVRISDSLKRLIRASIRRGNDEDEPPRVLARRIRAETHGEIGKHRAQRIARTETHVAAMFGSNAAAEATGLDLDKEWGATEDARTRLAHSIADGETVAKDADFIVGGERLRYPGDPHGSAGNIINCRCVILWRPRVPI